MLYLILLLTYQGRSPFAVVFVENIKLDRLTTKTKANGTIAFIPGSIGALIDCFVPSALSRTVVTFLLEPKLNSGVISLLYYFSTP